MKSRAAVVPLRCVLAAFVLALGSACSSPDGEVAPSMLATGKQAVQIGFCDAAAVVEAKCSRCHADPPVHGAPFSLQGYVALTEPSPTASNPERTRADRILAAVESGEMPYTALELDPPVEPLTCEERTTLLTWLESGADPPADDDAACTARAPALLACDETL